MSLGEDKNNLRGKRKPYPEKVDRWVAWDWGGPGDGRVTMKGVQWTRSRVTMVMGTHLWEHVKATEPHPPYLCIFREREKEGKGGRETGRERSMCERNMDQLPFTRLGIKPATFKFAGQCSTR